MLSSQISARFVLTPYSTGIPTIELMVLHQGLGLFPQAIESKLQSDVILCGEQELVWLEVVKAFSFCFGLCQPLDYSDLGVPGVGPPIALRAIDCCRHGIVHCDVDLLFVVH